MSGGYLEGLERCLMGVSKAFRGCLIVVLKVSGRCPEGVWKVWKEPGRCLENKKNISEQNLVGIFFQTQYF